MAPWQAPTKKPEDSGGEASGAAVVDGELPDDESMVAAERVAAGFALECEQCHAPIKPEWPRCSCPSSCVCRFVSFDALS